MFILDKICLHCFLNDSVNILKIKIDWAATKDLILQYLWLIILILIGVIILLKIDFIVSLIGHFRNKSKKEKIVKVDLSKFNNNEKKKSEIITDVEYKIKEK